MTEDQQHTVTREELFEQVWQTPMVQLAKEYGISDVGLAKVCKRMEVPRPPRGYWAKVEAGRAPPKPKLKALTKHGIDNVVITPVSEDCLVSLLKGEDPRLEAVPCSAGYAAPCCTFSSRQPAKVAGKTVTIAQEPAPLVAVK